MPQILTFTESMQMSNQSKMIHGTASRPSTSYTSRPLTSTTDRRPTTARTRTGISTVNNQDIICAVIEARGVSPLVAIAFLNLTSVEATLCQISDSQTYVRTIQKLSVYEPSVILIPNTSPDVSSKLHGCIEENLSQICSLQPIDRRYFAENAGLEYLHQLAFVEDIEAIKVSIKGYFFTLCCLAAVRCFP
jgi:DNA mismatch repair protein MSH4